MENTKNQPINEAISQYQKQILEAQSELKSIEKKQEDIRKKVAQLEKEKKQLNQDHITQIENIEFYSNKILKLQTTL